MRPRAPLAVLPLLGLTLTASARAEFPSVDVRWFTPPTDPHGSLYLEPAATPGSGSFNTSAWLSYSHRPAVLRDEHGAVFSKLVASQTSVDLLANIGITPRGALGLSLPVVLFQNGDSDATTLRWTHGGP